MAAVVGMIALVFVAVVVLDHPARDCTWRYKTVRAGQSGQLDIVGVCVPNHPAR